MIYNGITTSVAGSSYSVTTEPAVSTLKNGDVLIVTFHEASPKDPALIVGGTPIPIKNRTGKAFYMGDIKKNMVMTLGYNKIDNCFYTSETLVSGKRLQDIDKKNTAHPESIMYSHDTNEFANGDKSKSDFTMKMHELAGDIVSSNYFVHDKAGLDIVVGDPKIKGFVLKNGYKITILFSALPKANFSIKLHDAPAIPGGNESFQGLITVDSHCEFEYNKTANKWYLMRDSLYLLRNGATPMEGDLDMQNNTIKNANLTPNTRILSQVGDINLPGDEFSHLVMDGSKDKKKSWAFTAFGGSARAVFVISNTKTGQNYPLQIDADKETIYSFNKRLATQEYVDARVLQIGLYVHADWATAKTGWIYADGRTLPPSYLEYYKEYPDGKVLDARGRFLLGDQAGVYGRRSIGGASVHPLTKNEMPEHNHPKPANLSNYIGSGSYGGSVGGGFTSRGLNASQITGDTGGNTPHNNMPPYLVLPCYVYVGLNTAKATEPLMLKMANEDFTEVSRAVRRKDNGISKFHYLSGIMEFFLDAKQKITFYEEDVANSIKLNEILEPLKYEKNLCTILFDTNEDKAKTNKMIVRVDFDEFTTSEIQLDFKLQDKIQEILNKTSFEELVGIKEELDKKRQEEQDEKIKLELEKWQKENPLEYLKRQKITEIKGEISQKLYKKSFTESQDFIKIKNELIDFISMQSDIRTLKELDVSEIINQR